MHLSDVSGRGVGAPNVRRYRVQPGVSIYPGTGCKFLPQLYCGSRVERFRCVTSVKGECLRGTLDRAMCHCGRRL